MFQGNSKLNSGLTGNGSSASSCSSNRGNHRSRSYSGSNYLLGGLSPCSMGRSKLPRGKKHIQCDTSHPDYCDRTEADVSFRSSFNLHP